MDSFSLPKRMIRIICALTLLLAAGSAVYYRSLSCLPFVLGVLLGGGVSVLKVILLSRAVDRALELGEKNAGNYMHLQHFLRLLLAGGVLTLAALVPGLSLWGAAAGVLTFQIALYVLNLTRKL